MTWSVSASGRIEEVKRKVQEQVAPSHPCAAAAIWLLVDDAASAACQDGKAATHASVSGSGSSMVSLSVSTWRETEAQPAAGA